MNRANKIKELTEKYLKDLNEILSDFPEPDYLTAREVMTLLQITRQTLCHYLNQGIIEAYKPEGGFYKYKKDSVLKLLNEKIETGKKKQNWIR